MIKVTGNISIPKLQNLYSELATSDEAVIDVHLPKKIEKLDFGLLFSYLQFLATWIRNNRSGKLHLPVNNTAETIEYLDNNEFVYPSIVLAWEKEIVNANGENIKSELKNPSKEYFNSMDLFELKGTSVPIYCFDHDKSNRGLSRHLYKNFRELVNETTLSFNLFNAFKKVGDFNKGAFRTGIKGSYDDFIAIIHELFTNTHEHAKTNELGYNLYPNIRALQLKFHKKPIDKFKEQFQGYAGLVQYFNSAFKLNEQNELYIFEISILDSGPGFVKRYKKVSDYKLNIGDEAERKRINEQITKKNKNYRNNWYKYIDVGPNSYRSNSLGGIYGLEINVVNNTEYMLDEVIATITYVKANGDAWKTVEVPIYNVPANSYKTQPVPDVERGISVEVVTTAVISKKMHFCYIPGNWANNSDDPYFCK